MCRFVAADRASRRCRRAAKEARWSTVQDCRRRQGQCRGGVRRPHNHPPKGVITSCATPWESTVSTRGRRRPSASVARQFGAGDRLLLLMNLVGRKLRGHAGGMVSVRARPSPPRAHREQRTREGMRGQPFTRGAPAIPADISGPPSRSSHLMPVPDREVQPHA